MSYIDVVIPLAAGAIFVAYPQLFAKTDAKKRATRMIGFVLIGVAGLYFIVKLIPAR